MQTEELARTAIQEAVDVFPFEVFPYAPKDRRELRKIFNNIYLKNFPATWTEADLRNIFDKYGDIKSCVIMKKKREGDDTESAFGFICFERPGDREHGFKAA
jgi:RNA recognition motif-containing protein